MFVYVYILNKIHASNNAVPLILNIGGNPFYDKHTENDSVICLWKNASPSFLHFYFVQCLFCCDLLYLTAPLWLWWCLTCVMCTLCLMWNTFSLKSLMACQCFVCFCRLNEEMSWTQIRFSGTCVEKNQKSCMGVLSLSNLLKCLCCQLEAQPPVEIILSDELFLGNDALRSTVKLLYFHITDKRDF